MLEAQHLSIGYEGRTLAQDLDFSVFAGEIVAVLGPNGRGKTTLLRTLLGLLPAQAGHIQREGAYAYVPQQQAVPFAYDVLNIVTMGRARHLKWYQSPAAADYEIARACLDEVQLGHLADRSFSTLSGGQQQLVTMARALASESPLLVLDEPTAALDLRNQDVVLQVLDRLRHSRNLAIVFTTHQPQHALHIADKTLLMHTDGCTFGTTAQMCTSAQLSHLYGLAIQVCAVAGGACGRLGAVPMYSALTPMCAKPTKDAL
jgi:iron complex transport system ATP-binding protein